MSSEDDDGPLFWHPARQLDGKRHAIRQDRPPRGWSKVRTLCGSLLDPAPVSSTEWLLYPTCRACWDSVVRRQVPDFPCAAPEGDQPPEEG
ncbi:zinc-finger [Actinopolyspora alba]|uniref:Zinc-finger n=1 Tax=Actinopolyspora alba TaxID=673379 RepID=A0A1I1V2J8_9ACTN|nr:zinc finger protein [Actinopolyspora alba]SFD77134.1 zinc-finger [Actinopolyspora alba]